MELNLVAASTVSKKLEKKLVKIISVFLQKKKDKIIYMSIKKK